MAKGEFKVNLFDLIISMSNLLDLVSPSLADHHKQVAFLAFSLGLEIGLPAEERGRLIVAGALHDVGALSLKDRLATLQFEQSSPSVHAELGYLLLRKCKLFSKVANQVRYHHLPWNGGAGLEHEGKPVLLGSHILHLADRVAVLIDEEKNILEQAAGIRKRIFQHAGTAFVPKLTEAFDRLSMRESFWLDAVSSSLDQYLWQKTWLQTIDLDLASLEDVVRIFSQVVDFRSQFTATHSCGVAALAQSLASLAGFSETEGRQIKIAGYLHDLGKLAIPAEVIEKPAKLEPDEFDIMRAHPFHTFRALERIADLEDINAWASFHHERLDGNGYPFHRKAADIPLGSRIMAVADAFTAICEDRPYRAGMRRSLAIEVVQKMAERSALDANVVSLLRSHFDEVDDSRVKAQAATESEYKAFERHYRSPSSRDFVAIS